MTPPGKKRPFLSNIIFISGYPYVTLANVTLTDQRALAGLKAATHPRGCPHRCDFPLVNVTPIFSSALTSIFSRSLIYVSIALYYENKNTFKHPLFARVLQDRCIYSEKNFLKYLHSKKPFCRFVVLNRYNGYQTQVWGFNLLKFIHKNPFTPCNDSKLQGALPLPLVVTEIIRWVGSTPTIGANQNLNKMKAIFHSIEHVEYLTDHRNMIGVEWDGARVRRSQIAEAIKAEMDAFEWSADAINAVMDDWNRVPDEIFLESDPAIQDAVHNAGESITVWFKIDTSVNSEMAEQIKATADIMRTAGCEVKIQYLVPSVAITHNDGKEWFFQDYEAYELLNQVPENVNEKDWFLYCSLSW